jgi:ADP-heptose:LPS heptosyltransferase
MRIVVLHTGGIGDVVLLETFLAALREQHPDATLELVCRAPIAPVTRLYARPPDVVHAMTFNPYRWALPDDRAALEAKTLLAKLNQGDPVDLFVSAELRATWLSEILAAALRPREAVIADPREPQPSDVLILLGKLRLERNRAIRRPPAGDHEHELDRYARLAGHASRRKPALRTFQPIEGPAELVVFPVSANAANRWNLDAMGEAAQRIAASHAWSMTLISSDADRDVLESAVREASFGGDATIVTGAPDDLAAIAARIAGAAGYIGIDTGLSHIAQAYGVPGVTMYGGGYWPVYAPWSARSIGIVAPIPCFGCGWDCAFDHPYCIDGIEPDHAVAAFDTAYHDDSGEPLVRLVEPYSAREHEIFALAGSVHRVAQQDRAARLTAITRLRDLLSRYARRMRIRSRKADAELAALAESANRTSRRLDDARSGKLRVPAPRRRPSGGE